MLTWYRLSVSTGQSINQGNTVSKTVCAGAQPEKHCISGRMSSTPAVVSQSPLSKAILPAQTAKVHCRPLEAERSSSPCSGTWKTQVQMPAPWLGITSFSTNFLIYQRKMSPQAWTQITYQSPEALLPSELHLLAEFLTVAMGNNVFPHSGGLKKVNVGKKYPVIFLQNFLTVYVSDFDELVREWWQWL